MEITQPVLFSTCVQELPTQPFYDGGATLNLKCKIQIST